jgi:PAS domain S-box-containing protein
MMNNIRRDDVRQYSLQFGIGIAAVAAALLLSLLLRDFISATPLLLFFAAVLVSTWYGGLVVGVFSAILSLLSANYFFFTPQALIQADPTAFGRVLILLLFAGLVYVLRRSRQNALGALEQSRDQLAIILRDVADGITVQDATGKLIYANFEAARALGYATSEALLAAPLREIMQDFEMFDEDGQPFPPQSLPGRMALLGMRFPEATIRFVHKPSGQERWSNVKARPIFDAKGNVTSAINLFQDITKAKTAEQSVFQQREQLRVTLASIGDGVIATDIKGNITFMNPVAAKITGWRERDALGKPIQDVFRIISEDTRQPVPNPVERVLREGAIVGLANHTLLISKQGAEIPIHDSGAPIRDQANKLIGTVLVFRDTSDQRKAEQALEASEARYRNLVENASDMIYSLALDGTITSVNATGEQLLGYTREELLGKPVKPLIVPEEFEMMLAMLQRKVEGEEETTYELGLIAKDGRRLRFEINSRLMSDEKGTRSIYGIARDITQRQRPE